MTYVFSALTAFKEELRKPLSVSTVHQDLNKAISAETISTVSWRNYPIVYAALRPNFQSKNTNQNEKEYWVLKAYFGSQE